MKIAVEGCAHGELEKIYETISHLEKVENVKVDLLICCGDFQATRNVEDLRCMAVPKKYQSMCSFYKYYSGEKVAPVLTLFIGGNHEASNYLQELAYGGWVAPNIYYMGYASIVNIRGIRIAGLSGIYKGHDYMKGHFEKPPYSEETKRSVYHIRNLEMFRLKQVKGPIDIIMSHDWPRGVHKFGDVEELLKCKPFFKKDIESNCLGSRPSEELLHELKPTYWFSAHLHVKFSAIVPHKDSEEDRKQTKFLALDKCLPRRKFLQVIDVPHDNSKSVDLEYDLEWLTILFLTNHLLSVKKGLQYMPGPGANERWNFTPTAEELDLVFRKFHNNLRVPANFVRTVTPHSPNGSYSSPSFRQPSAQINPQTMAFCEQLSVDDPMSLLLEWSNSMGSSPSVQVFLPSFLTPEKPGDITAVSLNDSSNLDSSLEVENVGDECNSQPTNTPKLRKSLVLPGPRNSDVNKLSQDSPFSSQRDSEYDDDDNGIKDVLLPKSLSFPLTETKSSGNDYIPLSFSLSSPSCTKHSDYNDLPRNISPKSDSPEEADNKSSCEAVVTPGTPDCQPKMKKFKRRNQAIYCTIDEDC